MPARIVMIAFRRGMDPRGPGLVSGVDDDPCPVNFDHLPCLECGEHEEDDEGSPLDWFSGFLEKLTSSRPKVVVRRVMISSIVRMGPVSHALEEGECPALSMEFEDDQLPREHLLLDPHLVLRGFSPPRTLFLGVRGGPDVLGPLFSACGCPLESESADDSCEEAGNEDESIPITIKVDLDGTIAEKIPFDPDRIGPPRPGARETLRKWKDKGWRIIINTVRGDRNQVIEYLQRHNIPFDFVNYNPDQPPGSSHKIYADIDVDDTAVDADQPWEVIDELVNEKLRRSGRLKQAILALVPRFSVKAAAEKGEFAPGISDRYFYGNLFEYDKPEGSFILQRHLALRAGPHYDVRLGDPRGLFSWATRKEWPKEPGRILLFQQPMHSWKYKDFEGTIEPPTYGAGQVSKVLETPFRIVGKDKNRITFQLPEHAPGLRYTLIALPSRPGARRQVSRPWLLVVSEGSSPRAAVQMESPRSAKARGPLKREDALRALQKAESLLGPYVLYTTPVGSMLRHPDQEQFGDVDVLAIPKDPIPEDVARSLKDEGVDLYTADLPSAGSSLLHWGIGKRIVQIKALAKRHGYHLNQHGLWQKDPKTGKLELVTSDPREIFRTLSAWDPSLKELPSFIERKLQEIQELRKKSASVPLVCRLCHRLVEDCGCSASGSSQFVPYWTVWRQPTPD